MFIVLEGGDGTGKSTLVTHLAEKFGAIPYSTPPAKYKKHRDQVDRDASAEQHFAFYRDAVIESSAEISELVRMKKWAR